MPTLYLPIHSSKMCLFYKNLGNVGNAIAEDDFVSNKWEVGKLVAFSKTIIKHGDIHHVFLKGIGIPYMFLSGHEKNQWRSENNLITQLQKLFPTRFEPTTSSSLIFHCRTTNHCTNWSCWIYGQRS